MICQETTEKNKIISWYLDKKTILNKVKVQVVFL